MMMDRPFHFTVGPPDHARQPPAPPENPMDHICQPCDSPDSYNQSNCILHPIFQGACIVVFEASACTLPCPAA